MTARLDLTGHRFGKLVAMIRLTVASKLNGHSEWLCLCDCGRKKIVFLGNLRSGHTRSCGCILKTAGGLSHKERFTWNSYSMMLRRCQDPKHPYYHAYGGAGINVYFDWLGEDGFKNFLRDMGRRPQGMTLDRIRNAEGYGPDNCRWATKEVQTFNRRKKKK